MINKIKPLTRRQAEKLQRQVEDGHMGTMYVYPCTLLPQDTMTVFRAGKQQQPISRVHVDVANEVPARGVALDNYGRMHATCFLDAAEARSLAEALLTAAEEIDGVGLAFDIPDTPGDMGNNNTTEGN